MAVSDDNRKAEGLGHPFKNIGRASAKACKKIAENVNKNLGRALEKGAQIGRAAVFKKPEAALSTIPDARSFYQTGNGLERGKLVKIREYHENIPFCSTRTNPKC